MKSIKNIFLNMYVWTYILILYKTEKKVMIKNNKNLNRKYKNKTQFKT